MNRDTHAPAFRHKIKLEKLLMLFLKKTFSPPMQHLTYTLFAPFYDFFLKKLSTPWRQLSLSHLKAKAWLKRALHPLAAVATRLDVEWQTLLATQPSVRLLQEVLLFAKG